MLRQPKAVVAAYEPYPEILPEHLGVLMKIRKFPGPSFTKRNLSAVCIYLDYINVLNVQVFNEGQSYTIMRNSQHAPDDLAERLTKTQKIIYNFFLLQFPEENSVVALTAAHERFAEHVRIKMRKNLSAVIGKLVLADLKEKGFVMFDKKSVVYTAITFFIGLVFLAGLMNVSREFFDTVLGFWLLAIAFPMVSFVPALVFLFTKDKLTQKGEDAYLHMLGFREYLRVAEQDRFGFFESVKTDPKKFSYFLSYAIIFGLEDSWSALLHDLTSSP